MSEYKKSYKGLIIWLICFIAAYVGVMLLAHDSRRATLATMDVLTISVAVLSGMIFLNEKIYWYTGVTFEAAEKLSSAERKAYAWKYFVRFLAVAVGYIIFSVPAFVFRLPEWLTITVGCAAVIIAALSTINIKI